MPWRAATGVVLIVLVVVGCGSDLTSQAEAARARSNRIDAQLQKVRRATADARDSAERLATDNRRLRSQVATLQAQVEDLELVTSTSLPPTDEASFDATLACSHFRNIVEDIDAGRLTPREVKSKFREVHGNTKGADEPDLRVAGDELVGAAGVPGDARDKAIGDMGTACSRVGE